MKRFLGYFLGVFLIAGGVFASFQGFDGSTDRGVFGKIKCSTGLSCTRTGAGLFTMTSSPTIAGSPITVTGAEGEAGILQVQADDSDDDADDWAVSALDAGTLAFQTGASGSLVSLANLESDGDWIFSGTTPYLTIGDDGAEDAGLAFDGNAQSFNISLDDSVDLLVIGVGTAAGTTDAIRVDANQVVTFVQDVRGLGTDDLSGFLRTQTQATATTITAAQCGGTFYNAGAIEMELPEASTVPGCELTFIVGNASAFTIDPDAADIVVLATNAAGDSLIADAVGEVLVIEAFSASQWAVKVQTGTWTDSD